MKRFLICAALAALVVPAASFAQGPTGQDRENASRACRALRAQLGLETFRQTYGTVQSNRKNAFGKCVSQWSRTEHQNRISAREACSAEQADPNFAASHEGKTFDQYYGTGPKHRNAFGKCVSSKAKSASAEARQNTLNAAKQCKAERSELGPAEFRAKYGKNANDRNAFGKCVSALAKAQNS
jgi:hypothetical protein